MKIDELKYFLRLLSTTHKDGYPNFSFITLVVIASTVFWGVPADPPSVSMMHHISFGYVCQKKTGKIICTHCTCMAGLSQTCNHIAAALFCVEAASRMGLKNPSCTSKSWKWLLNNKKVAYMKVKDMKLKRSDFGQRGKKKTNLIAVGKGIYCLESVFILQERLYITTHMKALLQPKCHNYSGFPIITRKESLKSHDCAIIVRLLTIVKIL